MAYTEISDIRRGLPGLLSTVDYIGIVASGSHITTNVYAIACPTILKDGAELSVVTDYTFVRPDTITLSINASDEEYFARLDIGPEDETITGLILQADQIIDNKFYAYTKLAPPDEIKKTWSTQLTIGLYLSSYCAGSNEDIDKSVFYLDLANKGMDDYIKFTLRDTPTRPNRHRAMCFKV